MTSILLDVGRVVVVEDAGDVVDGKMVVVVGSVVAVGESGVVVVVIVLDVVRPHTKNECSDMYHTSAVFVHTFMSIFF